MAGSLYSQWSTGTGIFYTINNKVGIGTNNPPNKLYVTWSAAGPTSEQNRATISGINTSTDASYANSIGIYGSSSTSSGAGIYGFNSNVNGFGGYFVGKGYFSGKVGIGTISPDAQFEIKTPNNSASSYAFGIRYNSYNDIFSVWNNGAVAINRQNPWANLSINGGNMQYTASIEYKPRDFNDVGLLIMQSTCGGGSLDRKAFVVSYCGTSNENFVIYGNGKTFVNNKITAKEVEVKANVWADYVFKKDYKLMPLADLENYVKEHNRLPEIPSEAEVMEYGVNLGEMNVLLLKKIEEMTLYIIEQNKRISELEKNNKN